MPGLDLKPSEYRKSEPAGPILTAWIVVGYAVWTYIALGSSGWDWKLAVAFQVPAFIIGYFVAKRFRVERTPAGRNR